MASYETYLLGDGKTKAWMVRYAKPDGLPTKKRGFSTKRAAQEWATKMENAKLQGEFRPVSAGRIKIGEFGDRWLTHQSHWKPSSRRVNEIAWRVHVRPRWKGTPISAVLPSDVKDWIATMDLHSGPVTIERNYGILASILDAAVDDRLISVNPIRGRVKLPRRVERQHIYLTHDQVWALAGAADDKNEDNRTLVLFLAYTGMRLGEVAGLRVSHYNAKRRRVSVAENATEVGSKVEVGTPKGHQVRTVPIPMFLVSALAEQCAGKGPEDLIFPGPNDYLRPSHSETGWFEYARKRADLPRLVVHDLRHTAASLAVSAGANVKALQKMLGHKSAAETLDTYADLFDDDLEGVANALDAAVASAKCAQNVPTRPLKIIS